jgi:hypothetical protein
VPAADGVEKSFEWATTAHKTLKIFTTSEGGVERCQVDKRAIAVVYVSG